MATKLDIQLQFDGPSPFVAGDRRLTLINLAQLLNALNHGSRYRAPASSPYVQVTPSMVAAAATATCAAVQAGDTVSVGGQALTAAQRRATGTITCATAIAGNTFAVNGVTFTGVAGAATPGEATFSIDTSDTATAASIVTQVNAYASPKLNGVVVAKSTAAVVTVYAVNEGTAGNTYTLASSGSTLAVSAATLTNGAAAVNNTFDYVGSNATTAASLAAAITNSTTAAVQKATASASNAVVTVTSKFLGVAGNATAFVSSNGTRLAVTGSGFLASGTQGATTKWSF